LTESAGGVLSGGQALTSMKKQLMKKSPQRKRLLHQEEKRPNTKDTTANFLRTPIRPAGISVQILPSEGKRRGKEEKDPKKPVNENCSICRERESACGKDTPGLIRGRGGTRFGITGVRKATLGRHTRPSFQCDQQRGETHPEQKKNLQAKGLGLFLGIQPDIERAQQLV